MARRIELGDAVEHADHGIGWLYGLCPRQPGDPYGDALVVFREKTVCVAPIDLRRVPCRNPIEREWLVDELAEARFRLAGTADLVAIVCARAGIPAVDETRLQKFLREDL